MCSDFIQNPKDYYVYIKIVEKNIVFLVIFVDDILLAGNDISLIMEVKQWLIDKIEMKDRVEVSYFLGNKILKNKNITKIEFILRNLYQFNIK